MKTKNVIISVLCAVALVACETWEPNFPEGDYSLREQIESSSWKISTYILSTGKQVPIPPSELYAEDMGVSFGKITDNFCPLNWWFVNAYTMLCFFGDGHQLAFRQNEIGEAMLDQSFYTYSYQAEKFHKLLGKVDSGYIRNDTLFLLINPKKDVKYKAICLTNRK